MDRQTDGSLRQVAYKCQFLYNFMIIKEIPSLHLSQQEPGSLVRSSSGQLLISSHLTLEHSSTKVI